ncbi:MAG TPA: 16S rRNA (guanine(527)-N(7))-methyltransferase RsmG [Jatrophihabitans sp.]|nr:16S rRNA (guanine(527)-N(7))-methyltransferase RsmG [Jatrophihabitans sp.]
MPEAPAAARAVFGERLAVAVAYAARLAGDGVERGLIGPRELDRIWDRHVLNSAILTELIPAGARVVDVGSGAGLPGVAMAIRRPDLRVDLVEPMQRRVDFLLEVTSDLGLRETVRVWRGRAEEPAIADSVGNSEWVVARAVAPLDRLVRWCLPLLSPGGRLLALKGVGAAEEVTRSRAALRDLGATPAEVQVLGAGLVETPTRVVVVRGRMAGMKRGSR